LLVDLGAGDEGGSRAGAESPDSFLILDDAFCRIQLGLPPTRPVLPALTRDDTVCDALERRSHVSAPDLVIHTADLVQENLATDDPLSRSASAAPLRVPS